MVGRFKLNPLDEDFNMDRATDEDIFKAVMDSKAQRENAAANNGDNDIDNNALIEPPLWSHEALQAKITIEKYYIETMNLTHASWRVYWQTLPAQLSSLRPKK